MLSVRGVGFETVSSKSSLESSVDTGHVCEDQYRTMRFRPCIDLKNGKVVQIVGGSLDDSNADQVATNFISEKSSESYARKYQASQLVGGHVIALGPGNRSAALSALSAYPGGIQYGGGVTPENAMEFLDAGASQVIVTSYVFRNGQVDYDRLDELASLIGRDRLVLDMSCRLLDGVYWVVTDRWQKFTNVKVDAESLSQLSEYCCEFLVHGVDVEGQMNGIEEPLVRMLGKESPIPVTYAGGARCLEDLERVNALGSGRIDLTIGSALDIFGGNVKYADVVAWDQAQRSK